MNRQDNIKLIQQAVGVSQDGIIGPVTISAIQEFLNPASDKQVHRVLASSFADQRDIQAFREAKARGLSDQEAFKVGDNGVGLWGDDCTAPAPMCALPPEDWNIFGSAARGRRVLVQANGAQVICELRDTMPHRAHITNGAGIDLNEAAVLALGLKVPLMHDATWEWA